ncbi:hypothetical protein JZ751_011990 [Albula glossodonta]|uniref:Uncharacterized protein n=1 Tax=Albula glossodonta TaxID=121402 RepID=A0A8T2PRB0_9TELE|nr:hypothetical protein JZ751_011990 [Albula glossodonta]
MGIGPGKKNSKNTSPEHGHSPPTALQNHNYSLHCAFFCQLHPSTLNLSPSLSSAQGSNSFPIGSRFHWSHQSDPAAVSCLFPMFTINEERSLLRAFHVTVNQMMSSVCVEEGQLLPSQGKKRGRISMRKVSMGVSPISLKKKRCSRHLSPMERRAGSRSNSLANLLQTQQTKTGASREAYTFSLSASTSPGFDKPLESVQGEELLVCCLANVGDWIVRLGGEKERRGRERVIKDHSGEIY